MWMVCCGKVSGFAVFVQAAILTGRGEVHEEVTMAAVATCNVENPGS